MARLPLGQLSLELDRDGSDDTVVVTAVGEVTFWSAPSFLEGLLVAVDRGARAVVDLAAVGFIGADGISALLAASAEARQRGHQLILRNPSALLRRLLPVLTLTSELAVDEHAELAGAGGVPAGR